MLAAGASLLAGTVALPQAAQADIKWGVCAESNNIACGHLTVPLNPQAPSQGVITLALRRHRAPIGEAKDAVIALAGGPGQSAIPFLNQFAQLLGPIVDSRDLIAFDQRGTGFSHPLSCAAFEHLGENASPLTVSLCGSEIGETRGLYTTAQTVADIEAIRQAGGYEKLVLYGTSYGTKVAERYAQDYPSHVEALVLDSVVPPNGPEAFDRATFAAVPRILRQLCANGACAQITHDPVSDLARVVTRMGTGSIRGTVIDGHGRPHTEHVSSDDLIEVLLAGDFDPILRGEFPAAIRSARHGDTAALARLMDRASGGEGEEESPEAFDVPLYYSTICDETTFPWNPAANAVKRLREAKAVLSATGNRAFAPFTAANALALSDVPTCADWPRTPGGPEVNTDPLPNVPSLILSGADDLRTPTSGAREVGGQIPDSQLLVVPNTGHSVLGADPTPCAHNALKSFFEQRTIKQCKEAIPPPLFLPTPLPPRSIAAVAPAHGNRGLPGKTLQSALLTLGDFDRQLLLTVLENIGEALFGSGTVRTGGLRAGWGGIVHGKLVLHGYSYVPGVTVTGTLSSKGSTFHIGGRAAARGTLRIGTHGTLSGVLGGHGVHLSGSSPSEAGIGFSIPRASTHLSGLAADPKRLELLRAKGMAALLRYVFGA
ncbi:MAG TPA: alpha/beta fold hydrolase [Solirubrobacteraceae bacterium]|nr:alpha/beta fold hydrolase [Solirubrobacteraceae bacterium]